MGRRALRGFALLLVMTVVACLAVPAAAGDAEAPQQGRDVGAAVERVFSSKHLQGDLPTDAPPPMRERPSPSWAPSAPSAAAPAAATGAASGLATGLGWGALGVGVVLLVLWLLSLRGEPAAAVEASPPRIEGQPVAAAAPSVTPGAERRALELAAAGRVDEAVHVLLLDAAGRVLLHAGRAADVALTSREVAPAAGLRGPRSDAFGTLVSFVERSRFGGRPLVPADMDAACGAYRTAVAS